MSKFAISIIERPQYPHYPIFKEIAETLHYGLQELGYDSLMTYDLGHTDRVYIILAPHNVTCFDGNLALPNNSILYNFEQIYLDSPWLTSTYLDYLAQYPIWDYSKANIQELKRLGIDNVQFLPLGYVSQITRIESTASGDIDVLFYGYINERRQKIIDELKYHDLNVYTAFNIYGNQRDNLISRSKIVLNIHYYDAKIFEIARVFYLLANRKFVVSEIGSDADAENPFRTGVAFADYDSLVRTCLYYLHHPEERNRIAEAGFEIMKSRPEKDFIAAVIPSIQYNPNKPKTFIKDLYRKRLAKNFFINGKYEEAIKLYEESIEMDPLCLESYCYLGLSLLYCGEELGAQLTWSLGLEQETGESEDTKTMELIKMFQSEIQRQNLLHNSDLAHKLSSLLPDLH
jgi:tetratricopeptide (TPR) repeat protein